MRLYRALAFGILMFFATWAFLLSLFEFDIPKKTTQDQTTADIYTCIKNGKKMAEYEGLNSLRAARDCGGGRRGALFPGNLHCSASQEGVCYRWSKEN